MPLLVIFRLIEVEIQYLLLVFADMLHGEEEEPIRRVLQQRCTEPVDEARCVGFLIAEHVAQRTFDQFLRRNTNCQVNSQFTEIRC